MVLSFSNLNLLWGNRQIQHCQNPTYFALCQRPKNCTLCSIRYPHIPSLIKVNSEIAGERDKVKCAFCGLRLIYWDPEDTPMKEHKRFRPECPFLRGLVVNAGAYFSLFLDHLFIRHIHFYMYSYY